MMILVATQQNISFHNRLMMKQEVNSIKRKSKEKIKRARVIRKTRIRKIRIRKIGRIGKINVDGA